MNPPKLLVASSNWSPASARMVSALVRNGCQVATLGPTGSPMGAVPGVQRHHRYSPLRSLASLKLAIAQEDPELILPCDPGVVRQLHALYRSNPELRPLIERSLGSPESFATTTNRAQLLVLASTLNIRTPDTRVVQTEADVVHSGLTSRCVLQKTGSADVGVLEFAANETDALNAFRRLSKTTSIVKKLLVDRDPLALWDRHASSSPRITLQPYLVGRPAHAMLLCHQGRVTAQVAVEVLYSQGLYGPPTVVRIITNPEMAEASCKLAGHLGLSGFYGFDFLLDIASGQPSLLGMHPCVTQLGHQNLLPEGSLAGILAAHLHGISLARVGTPITGEIAFFPDASNLNPDNPYLHRGFHDVPWDEPTLMHELVKPPWPQRQLIARIYHWLKPAPEPREVAFEAGSQATALKGGWGQR